MTHAERLTAIGNFFAIALLSLLIFPSSVFKPLSCGLDPSWGLGLQMAMNNHLTFGKDFILTYGPLGFLDSRYAIGVSQWTIFAIDMYVILNLILIFIIFFKKSTSKIHDYGLLLLTLLIAGDFYSGGLSFTLIFIKNFMTLYGIKNKNSGAIYNSLVLSILLFLFKSNLGFLIMIFTFFEIALIIITRSFPKRSWIAFLVFYVVGILVSAKLLNLSIPGYFAASMHIINGYNDAMVIPVPSMDMLLKSVVILVSYSLFWACFYFTGDFQKSFTERILFIYLGLITVLFMFILFKQSFVRADSHMFTFFRFSPLLIFLPYMFLHTKWQQQTFVLLISLTIILSVSVPWPGQTNPLSLNSLARRFTAGARYVGQLANEPRIDKRPLSSCGALPEEILKQTKGGSFDVMPWDISYIFYNDLPYAPRPVIQSYVPFDGYLDNINYQKYLSDSAPDYVLYENMSIDYRYPFWDESKTKMALLKKYKTLGRFNKFVLFKKLDMETPSTVIDGAQTRLRLGEALAVPESKHPVYLQIKLDYSRFGKIKRTLLQPPILFVKFRLQDGREHSYRAVKPILEGGVLVSEYIPDTAAAYTFFSRSDDLNLRIVSLSIDSPDRNSFEEYMTAKFSEFVIKP